MDTRTHAALINHQSQVIHQRTSSAILIRHLGKKTFVNQTFPPLGLSQMDIVGIQYADLTSTCYQPQLAILQHAVDEPKLVDTVTV